MEIIFNQSGNTIIGNYGAYAALDRALAAKSVFVPFGKTVSGDEADIRRLTEYVSLFGHCIKSLKGFANACKIAGCDIKSVNDSENCGAKEDRAWNPVSNAVQK